MKTLIFGAGLMAGPVAYDLVRQKDVERVFVVDQDRARLNKLRRWLKSPKVKTLEADVTNRHLIELLAHCAVAVSCVPYQYNLKLTRMAIAAKTNFCDLGGNNTVVRKQLALNKKAEEAKITVIPDCGLAPGITNIIVADAISRFDKINEVHIRVGGLPQKPEPPLYYRLVFSAQGLLNEYIEPCLVLRNGKIVKVKALTEPEEIVFPKPFGKLEAFHTSGGSSTLVETLKNRVRELDYKTIRYPQHRLMFQLLLKAAVGNWQKMPRALLACALEKVLGFEKNDCVLLRVDANGKVHGRKRLLRYQLIDYADKKNGLTAMMRTTGFSAAIVALMLARGEIEKRGVLPGELTVPSQRFIAELRSRGLNLQSRML